VDGARRLRRINVLAEWCAETTGAFRPEKNAKWTPHVVPYNSANSKFLWPRKGARGANKTAALNR